MTFYTAQSMWDPQQWDPQVEFEDASEDDKKMYAAHADSVNLYNEGKED